MKFALLFALGCLIVVVLSGGLLLSLQQSPLSPRVFELAPWRLGQTGQPATSLCGPGQTRTMFDDGCIRCSGGLVYYSADAHDPLGDEWRMSHRERAIPFFEGTAPVPVAEGAENVSGWITRENP